MATILRAGVTRKRRSKLIAYVVRDIRESSYALQTELIGACEQETKFSLFSSQRTSPKDFIHRVRELEALATVVGEENEIYVIEKKQSLTDKILQNIALFLIQFGHYLEHYGCILLSGENLALGTSLSGRIISVSPKQRGRHQFVIGSSGSGKSAYIQMCIIFDILSGKSGMFIDPFCNCAREIAAWVFFYQDIRKQFLDMRESMQNYLDSLINDIPQEIQDHIKSTQLYEKASIFEDLLTLPYEELFPEIHVHIADYGSKVQQPLYKVNLFKPFDGLSVEEVTSMIVDSVSLIQNAKKEETPTVKNFLESLFSLITVNDGNINDILMYLSVFRNYAGTPMQSDALLKFEALNKLKDHDEPICKNSEEFIRYVLSLRGSAYSEKISSSRSRLSHFLNSRLCTTFFGAPDKSTFDVEKIVNGEKGTKYFTLFMLPFEDEGAGIIGQWLMRALEKVLFNRTPEQTKNPFHLYADEFHRLLSANSSTASAIADKFNTWRQTGGNLTVCLQHSGQLRKDDPSGYVFSSVVQNCHTKVIFNVSGEDAKFFAENIFNQKGRLYQYTINTSYGTGTVVGKSHSNTESIGSSKTESTNESETISNSKAISHTVNQSFSELSSNSNTTSQSNSAGQCNNKSTGKGLSYQDPMDDENMRFSKNSVISAGYNSSKTKGQSNTEGTSTGCNKGTSDGHTETTGSSKTFGSSVSNGISSGTSESIGAMSNINNSKTVGFTAVPMSITEEEKFYAQELRNLEPREVFISIGNQVTKAITLDSICIKLEEQIAPYLNNYYEKLCDYQEKERLKYLEDKPSLSNEKNHPMKQVQSVSPRNLTGTHDLF